ncbi:MAG: hypothetical protein IJP87_04875, partial [Campylobacter sp.]|nr:hypothetical protein [Campylobacter sp.]
MKAYDFKKTTKTFLFSFAVACVVSSVKAEETTYIVSGGKNMFDLVFFDRGECPRDSSGNCKTYNTNSGSVELLSSGTLTQDQKRVAEAAAQYWADILAPGSNNNSAPSINVVADSTGNYKSSASFIYSVYTPNVGEKYTALMGNIINGYPYRDGGNMWMGTQVDSDPSLVDTPSMVSKRDVMHTTIHEIGHGLGVSKETLATYIIDRNGNNFKDDPNSINTNAGAYMDSGVAYQGAKTLEVLGDYRTNYGMRGLPLNGKEGGGSTINGSHFELDNSLQSHQNWRNWVTFMEAEFAVLVDLGYDIDLRNLYGHSEYANNKTYTNNNGFFARNSARNGYLIDTPNTQTYGIGFHLYGKKNDITQGANLLADGKASAGVRIDGSDNIFTIANGTKVTANGTNGMGIWTAFGKDHTININGEVEATGQGGIGIRADFGENTLGDDKEGRGSHFRWIKYSNGTFKADLYNSKSDPTQGGKYIGQTYDDRTPEMDLDGALMSNLNIGGKVTGNQAAVYIAKNAHVENINIGSNANITGNIKSDWESNLEWLYDYNKNVYNGLFNDWYEYGSKE